MPATDIYRVSFGRDLLGNYTLHVVFDYPKNSSAFFKTTYITGEKDKQWITAIDVWPMKARELFPCWDEPTFVATFDFAIDHHINYTLYANTARDSHDDPTKDIKRISLRRTPPIPTYQISIILLPRTKFSSGPVDNIYFAYRNDLTDRYHVAYAQGVLLKFYEYFETRDLSCEKDPYHVIIPHFPRNYATNLGIIVHSEQSFIFSKVDPEQFIRRPTYARYLGHTVAYQCFINHIGENPWSYQWLNHAFSTLLVLDAIDKVSNHPEYYIKDLFVVEVVQESLRLDDQSILRPLVENISSPFDSNSFYYSRPVCTKFLNDESENMGYFTENNPLCENLLFLRFGCIGSVLPSEMYLLNLFILLLSTFYRIRPHNVFNTSNIETFWSVIRRAHDIFSYYDLDVGQIRYLMERYLVQERYPVITVTQNETVITAVVNDTNTPKKAWLIPYTFTTETTPDAFNLSKSSATMKILTTGTKRTYSREKIKSIIFNLQQTGKYQIFFWYYRVNYKDGPLKNIAYLTFEEYGGIHVINRAQIMDDAFYFLMKGEIKVDTFTRLTRRLLLERNYTAWYPMFKAFEYMSSFFPFKESSYIKRKMIRILDPLHQEMAYEYGSDTLSINSSLQQEAARWACAFGSFECRNAYFKLISHMMDKRPIMTWWKDWTYCNGLRYVQMLAEYTTWEELFDKCLLKEEHIDYVLLKSLACPADTAVIKKYLQLIINEDYDEKLGEYGRLFVFHTIVEKHAKNNEILSYILEHFVNVKPRLMKSIPAIIHLFNHVYTKEALQKIYDYVEDKWMNFIIPLGPDAYKRKKELRESQIDSLLRHFQVLQQT
ncbi:PREDICTED: aminopeptidase N-like [Vollenhovia emeryi]|uniref:aminopeptidase N-like n=1 Tax=Vollenhovia emeryi TaxID=411798 RepID=UPI0005F50113|nr:PREDICTED: aminopeptidase N-like [Vollenhovia emeryi]